MRKAILVNTEKKTVDTIDLDKVDMSEALKCTFTGAFVSQVWNGSKKEYTVFHDDEFLYKEDLKLSGCCRNYNEQLYNNIIIARNRSMSDAELEEVKKNIVNGAYHYKHV